MALSPGCMQDAWAPPITRYSVHKSVNHVGMGTVLQQSDAMSSVSWPGHLFLILVW